MNRRAFLQALGLGSGSLFLPSAGMASTTAQPARRIVFYMTGQGTVPESWTINPAGLPPDQDYEIDLTSLTPDEFSPILRPLHGHADKLLVLDGIAYGTAISVQMNQHHEGRATALTGSVPVSVDGGRAQPTSASLDQILGANRTTPFRTLEYASHAGNSPCYDELGQSIPLQEQPNRAFDRLFPPGTGDVTTTEGRVARRQGWVLDQVAARYNALIPSLGSEDRVKLETHLDLVRDLEGQIAALDGLVCEGGTRPPHTSDRTTQLASFQSLMATALSCGLTDIVTIRVAGPKTEDIGAPPGDIHGDYAHGQETDPAAAAVMTDYQNWNASKLAEFLDLLDAIPEGGGSMLDHTIVVWTNELATGGHKMDNIPIVIAGGTEFFDTGRLVRWAPQHELVGFGGQRMIGQTHNRLLVTLAHAMGETSIQQVGASELALAAGGSLSAMGVLDRVCL